MKYYYCYLAPDCAFAFSHRLLFLAKISESWPGSGKIVRNVIILCCPGVLLGIRRGQHPSIQWQQNAAEDSLSQRNRSDEKSDRHVRFESSGS